MLARLSFTADGDVFGELLTSPPREAKATIEAIADSEAWDRAGIELWMRIPLYSHLAGSDPDEDASMPSPHVVELSAAGSLPWQPIVEFLRSAVPRGASVELLVRTEGSPAHEGRQALLARAHAATLLLMTNEPAAEAASLCVIRAPEGGTKLWHRLGESTWSTAVLASSEPPGFSDLSPAFREAVLGGAPLHVYGAGGVTSEVMMALLATLHEGMDVRIASRADNLGATCEGFVPGALHAVETIHRGPVKPPR